MSGRMQGKRVVVTGSASGIGRGVTRRMLDEGATVAGMDVNAEGLRQWDQAAAGGKIKFEENWVMGKRQGVQKSFDGNGVATLTEYRDDRPVQK